MVFIGTICLILSGVVAWKTGHIIGWFLGAGGFLIYAITALAYFHGYG